MDIFGQIIIAFLAGAGGSIVTLGPKWFFEQKKLLRKDRVALLNKVKSYINRDNFSRQKFMNNPSYITLKGYFSEELIDLVETSHIKITITKDRATDYLKHKLLNEIDQLERKWKLI